MTTPSAHPSKPVSKTKLLLGAGALFLFIVGVRKSWPRPSDAAAEPSHPRGHAP